MKHGPESEVHKNYKGGVKGLKVDAKLRAEVVPVVVNRELRQNTEEGSTRHLELDISRAGLMSYITADNLGVFPRNDYKIAAKVAKRLGAHPKDIFAMKPKDPKSSKKVPFPPRCTVHDALLWYSDIASLAKSKLVLAFASYATSPKEKAQLLSFAKDDKEAFAADQKSVYELLEEFPSVNIPLGDFLELVPRMQPRFYTIASSTKVSPHRIAVTVTVSETRKPRGRIHKGVCSTYMGDTKEGEEMMVFVRASSFRFPALRTTPLIMVGPGTGVAPFRAFWQEGQELIKAGTKLGDWVLFFGCRNNDKDWIYKEEMEAAQKGGPLTDVMLAFSRDTKEKVYVQHLIERDSERMWRLLNEQKAWIYVCGGTAMGRDVRSALTHCAERVGGLSAQGAGDYIKDLQASGRYIQELWS